MFQVDLWPDRGHDRQEVIHAAATPPAYADRPFGWECLSWRCGTCGVYLFSDAFPAGTGGYARDGLQRKWDAHLTPEHPSA